MTKRTGPGRGRTREMKLEELRWSTQTWQHQRGIAGGRNLELKPGWYYKETAEPTDRWGWRTSDHIQLRVVISAV